MEITFYFEDFDVTNQTLKALNNLASMISEKEQISLEEATDKLITSNIFKKFMNPCSMMWAKNINSAYEEYKSQMFPIYIHNDKDITREINEKIIIISNILSENNNLSKIEAACVLMNNDDYNFIDNPDMLYPNSDIEDVVKRLQVNEGKKI